MKRLNFQSSVQTKPENLKMGVNKNFMHFFAAVIIISLVVFYNFYPEKRINLEIYPTFRSNCSQIMSNKSISMLPLNVKYLWRPKGEAIPNDDRILDQLTWIKQYSSSSALNNDSKICLKQILAFGSTGSYYNTGGVIKCPDFQFNNCSITITENIENHLESIGNYDAVIFTNYRKHKEVATKIPANVKRIVYILESPKIVHLNFPKDTLLATYHRASDISIPYSKWIPFENGRGATQTNALGLKNFAEGKSEMAIIFVSDCSAKNNRLGYVHALQEFISVDVFGRCGQETSCSWQTATCMKTIIAKYKFYLAFENANCRDYITEKFHRNALQFGAVPIVLGAHPDDYKAVAPLNSFISVEDFESPRKLAEYLKLLDKNDTLYSEYFGWRGSGYFYDSIQDFFCRACGMIHYGDHVAPQGEAKVSWRAVSKCLPNRQWYWRKNSVPEWIQLFPLEWK